MTQPSLKPSERTSLNCYGHTCSFRNIARVLLVHFLLASCDIVQELFVATAFKNQSRNTNGNLIMRGAWKSQGKNQRELVEQLRKKGIIRSDSVQNVMGVVDRGNYCFLRPKFESESDHICYVDRALGIGMGQTISAPHMHAYALEEILTSVASNPHRSSSNSYGYTKILDVGCGSGYLTACFGRWLSDPKAKEDEEFTTIPNSSSNVGIPVGGGGGSGKVYGIDVRNDLVDMTRKNIERADGDLLEDGVVDLSLRDGWKGLPEHAPFDAIHVGAAAATLPKVLANQLKVGGVLVIPIGPQNSSKHQVLYKIKRVDDSSNGSNDQDYYSSDESFNEKDYEVKSLLGVRYVPLVKAEDLRTQGGNL